MLCNHTWRPCSWPGAGGWLHCTGHSWRSASQPWWRSRWRWRSAGPGLLERNAPSADRTPPDPRAREDHSEKKTTIKLHQLIYLGRQNQAVDTNFTNWETDTTSQVLTDIWCHYSKHNETLKKVSKSDLITSVYHLGPAECEITSCNINISHFVDGLIRAAPHWHRCV